MNFTLQRLYHTTGLAQGDYTAGFLTNESQSFRSWCLEDTYHAQKIHGSTRIPGGRLYELGLRKEATPLTLKHREAYKALPWFKAHPNWFHIEITKVPEYSGVYIHSGNDDAHTLGCLLPAYSFDISLLDKPSAKSMLAVNDFYAIAYPILESGSKVFITIKDENQI